MHELLEQLFELKTQWLQIAKTISNETGKDELAQYLKKREMQNEIYPV